MSKSKGNLVFVSRLRADGVDPMAVRLALIAGHYRADRAVDRRRAQDRRSSGWPAGARPPPRRPARPARACWPRSASALADDLDTPGALAVVDAWADAALAGAGDDAGAPALMADDRRRPARRPPLTPSRPAHRRPAGPAPVRARRSTGTQCVAARPWQLGGPAARGPRASAAPAIRDRASGRTAPACAVAADQVEHRAADQRAASAGRPRAGSARRRAVIDRVGDRGDHDSVIVVDSADRPGSSRGPAPSRWLGRSCRSPAARADAREDRTMAVTLDGDLCATAVVPITGSTRRRQMPSSWHRSAKCARSIAHRGGRRRGPERPVGGGTCRPDCEHRARAGGLPASGRRPADDVDRGHARTRRQ